MSVQARALRICWVGQSVYDDCLNCGSFGLWGISRDFDAAMAETDPSKWVGVSLLCPACNKISAQAITRRRELSEGLIPFWEIVPEPPRDPTPDELPLGGAGILSLFAS